MTFIDKDDGSLITEDITDNDKIVYCGTTHCFGGWQPIETADKRSKNSVILLCGPVMYVGSYRGGRLGEPQPDVIAWRCDSSGMFAHPTHWMPKPPLPNKEV